MMPMLKLYFPTRKVLSCQLWHVDNTVLALFGNEETATLEKGLVVML